MTKPNILVTGGAGYIGSHTCKAISEAGFTPVTIDNLSRGNEWAVKWGPFEECGIEDQQAVQTVLQKYQPQAVVHFAAYAYVGESVENPPLYYRNNLGGSLSLIEAIKNYGAPLPLCFSSTCAVYGTPPTVPISEDMPMAPVSPYGRSKLLVEQALASCKDVVPSVSLRYFNAAGADRSGEIGEAHDPETHLIPLVLEAAAGLRPEIAIFGSDYPTPDGTAIRDYIHVTDLADAHVKAVQYLLAGGSTVSLNLGTGHGYSVKEIIAAVERVTGKTVPTRTAPRREGDPAALVADPMKAVELLDLELSSYMSIDATIETAWKFMQQRETHR